MTKALMPLLLKSSEKTIVNLTSIGAHILMPGASGYLVTKFALLRYAEFIMVDPPEILAYSVHLGGIMTEMGMKMPEEAHGLLTDTVELPGDTIAFLTRKKRE
jgi:NAD(P)-dependent dehydrogenase (short-subunit alcohol dehydrogenase family)